MKNKKIERYNVKMTEIEAMKLDKWISNNSYAMNTLTECQRKDFAQDILCHIRMKKINIKTK